jgi:hypothetical protein
VIQVPQDFCSKILWQFSENHENQNLLGNPHKKENFVFPHLKVEEGRKEK